MPALRHWKGKLGLIKHFRPEIERRIDRYTANPLPDAPMLVAAE